MPNIGEFLTVDYLVAGVILIIYFGIGFWFTIEYLISKFRKYPNDRD